MDRPPLSRTRAATLARIPSLLRASMARVDGSRADSRKTCPVKRACGTLFVYWRGQRVPQRVEDVKFFDAPRIADRPKRREHPRDCSVSAATRNSPSPAIKRPADSETDLVDLEPASRGLGTRTKAPGYCPSRSPTLLATTSATGMGCGLGPPIVEQPPRRTNGLSSSPS